MRSGEALAYGSSFVDGLMKNWHWPRLQWVREILVSLSEFGFRCVPPDVYQACEGRFFGFNQTVIIENAMQMFEAISHDSKTAWCVGSRDGENCRPRTFSRTTVAHQ